MNEEEVLLVKRSYGKCLATGDVIGEFYEEMFKQYPEIQAHFKHTDFTEQKKLLRHGINLLIMFAQGLYAGEKGIERIRDTHKKTEMNIDPKHYTNWKKCLLTTVSKYDNSFNVQTEMAWDRVLQFGIDYIVAGYNK